MSVEADKTEKHLLGNLLDDDPGSGTTTTGMSSSSNANNHETSSQNMPQQLPTAVFRPLGGTNFWPEPPPPYTPRSYTESCLTTNSSSTSINPLGGLSDWFSFNPKEAATTASSDVFAFNLTGQSSAPAPPAPSQTPTQPTVHHFHHNLHHHTHTHNVQVQNHYFATSPNPIPSIPNLMTTPLDTGNTAAYDHGFGATWDYNGLSNINTDSNQLSFSAWKKQENMISSATPTTELCQEDVIGKSKVHKLSVPYGNGNKRSGVIGCEKKQKQELAKQLSNNQPSPPIQGPILVKGQPHSAPVATKMPFSYRDVAARVEPVQQPHSEHQMRKESTNESKSTENVSKALSTTSESKSTTQKFEDGENTKKSQMLNSERKSRSDNEFQKITRKNNRNGKDKSQTEVPTPVIYENVKAVDASSRYDVLKDMDKVPRARARSKKSINARASVVEEVFSRSSSPGDDDSEVDGRARSESTQNNNNMANQNSKKSEKKKAQAANRGGVRRKGKRAEPSWIENTLYSLGNYIAIIAMYVCSGFQWTMQLIIDTCLKIYDVVCNMCENICDGMCSMFKRAAMSVIMFFVTLWMFVRSMTFAKMTEVLINLDKTEITQWGLRREIPVPATATEYIDRLVRETTHDAYSVLGLKSDCADDDIRRNFKKLAALVCPDKCTSEGAEEAMDLLVRAMEAISTADCREAYTPETANSMDVHRNLIATWDDLRERIDDARCSIHCECGTRHTRFPTNIRPNEARYCRKCETTHPAKQNDIWVEKRFFGLKSVFFTCTDNMVYDITEWAMCESQRKLLKNIRAGKHNVQYRIVAPATPIEMEHQHMAYPNGTNTLMNSTPIEQQRFLNDFSCDEYPSIIRQHLSLAQISLKKSEPREEDRSRRAANRRQKRWR